MRAGDSKELALRLAELADSKKAEDIVVLDMRELVSYTDFLVIGTARGERQSRSITDEVRLRLKNDDELLPSGMEGDGPVGWVVMDYLDCVLHVFTAEARERFALEELWHEAPRLELSLGEDAPAAAAG